MCSGQKIVTDARPDESASVNSGSQLARLDSRSKEVATSKDDCSPSREDLTGMHGGILWSTTLCPQSAPLFRVKRSGANHW